MRKLILYLSMALLLPACQTLGERESAEQLEQTLTNYAGITRWEDLNALYGFLQPGVGPEIPPPGLDRLQVVSYEVIASPRMLAEDRAAQSVRIKFVDRERQVVHTLVDHQIWSRNEAGTWLRANPIPDFR